MADQADLLKSLNNDTPTFVTFENRTGRVVNLFWLSYEGKPVRYGVIPQRHSTSINTYVTHPWIARDQRSNFLLLINGRKVFYPVAQRDNVLFTSSERDQPHIHIPVFPLIQCCMETIYRAYNPEALQSFNIPKDLKESIRRMCPLQNVINYSRINVIRYAALEQQQQQAGNNAEPALEEDAERDEGDAEAGDEGGD